MNGLRLTGGRKKGAEMGERGEKNKGQKKGTLCRSERMKLNSTVLHFKGLSC